MSEAAKKKIQEQIETIMRDSGIGEDVEFVDDLDDNHHVRKIYEKALNGELQAEETQTITWEEARERDVVGNFLYGEYLQHRMVSREPLDFTSYVLWIGAKALFRLVMRIKGGERKAQALSANLDTSALNRFVSLDMHLEKDPRLLMGTLFKEVEGALPAVENILLQYRDTVEDAWEKRRMKNERTPLPGETDWYFEEENPLDMAVDAYLAGASIQQAAKDNKVGNKRLMRELTRLGIERVQRKGSK